VGAGGRRAGVSRRLHGGNLDVHTSGEWLTSLARLTGLLSAYLALVQVLLLARIPALERAIGLDRLSVWHRWNGHACIDLVVAHVLLSVWGYAELDRLGFFSELSTMIGGGIYPGMITATIGTFALIAVVVSSLVIVKRRLRYEWWYAVLGRVRTRRARARSAYAATAGRDLVRHDHRARSRDRGRVRDGGLRDGPGSRARLDCVAAERLRGDDHPRPRPSADDAGLPPSRLSQPASAASASGVTATASRAKLPAESV
jgi:Ferric reductase like transmembrane component